MSDLYLKPKNYEGYNPYNSWVFSILFYLSSPYVERFDNMNRSDNVGNSIYQIDLVFCFGESNVCGIALNENGACPKCGYRK